MAIEKLSIILELVSGNYKKEAKEAADATGRIGGAAKSVTGSLAAMIGPAAIAGAVVGLGKMALAAGENADRLFDLQAQTGLSTDELQRWEFVAKAAGATTEVFSDAVKAVIRNLDSSEGATGAAADAYETLGINVKGANGQLREAGDITAEVFEKLAGMENITERNALAQDLFGKKWEETISVLDLGSAALGDLREEGAKGIISAEALRNSDKFRETWQKFMAQVGPKLNEALGKLSPALTAVAEAAIDAFDAMEPLIDALGFVADKFGDMNVAVDEGRESSSRWAQSWAVASDIGQGAIFGMVGVLGALFDEENALRDNTVTTTGEIHDSWMNLIPTSDAIATAVQTTATAHQNAATAASNQRDALIDLKNTQADLLDPIRNVLSLQKESVDANQRLTDALKDTDTSASDLAIAVIEAEQAELRLQAAGAALTPEQVQAFARTLIDDLGLSEDAALDLLNQLNLLKGWEGTATFTLEMNTVASGGAAGNINEDFVKFAGGGTVPGWRGQPQLIVAHGGELITPAGATTNSNSRTMNNYFAAPVKPVDLQWISLQNNLETLVS